MMHIINIHPSTTVAANGYSSNGRTMHSQCSSKFLGNNTVKKSKYCPYFRPWVTEETEAKSIQSLEERVTDTLHDKHLEYTAHKVENLINPLTNSNNVTSIPATTTIPPSSMAAIQQSMVNANANAIPIMPPSLTPPTSPYAERFGDFTMDMRPLYTQASYVNTAGNMLAYPTNYRPTNQYMFNVLHPQRPLLIPAQPGPAHSVVSTLPYTSLPMNSTAGQYYHTNVAPPWSNVTYRNNVTTQYIQQPVANQVYPTAMQQNKIDRIQERSSSAPPSPKRAKQLKRKAAELPRSRSFPNSAALNSLATQSNMDNKTLWPEVQVALTTSQRDNEPKKQAKNTKKRQSKQADKPNISDKAPSKPPTSTKTLLPAAATSNSNAIKRKSIDDLAEQVTVSAKKLKMISSAFKLEDILAYRPNMARHRPKKDESKEAQLAREQNTIACRKYRRMRRIAKILEQKMVEAESVSHFVNII
nr:uncharacterized protein LOC106615118 [Bactrocera oleae]